MNIYKQIDELTLADLQNYPVWSYLSEDDPNAKDECSIKGYSNNYNKIDSTLIVYTKFILKDCSIYYGYVHPEKELSNNQPVIINEGKYIYFWNGIRKPTEHEIVNNYKNLGKKPDEVFPIKWETIVKIGKNNSDIIYGFGYLKREGNILDYKEDFVK